MRQNRELVEGKLALEDGIRGLTTLDETTLKTLDEGHGLLHLTKLADLAVKLLIVDGDVERIEGIADKVDVLLLPDGVLLSGVDSNLLGLAGVEGNVLALGQTLGEVGLSGENGRGGTADVGLGSGESGGRLGNGGELGEVDGFGLLSG